jgi:DNA polymerase (family 10)
MKWIPPELREDRGEIEASLNNALPELIEPSDIQGDLHIHSNWSDGKSSIEEIANAAKKFGYKYIAICDHSQAVKVANGLTIDRIKKQMDEIDKLNKKLKGITVLKGSEVDIKPNGELDYPESVLKKLDIIVAAIHSGFKESKEQITNRILQAIENPYVDIIAHPTGRVINQRDPYAVDLELVIEKAAGYKKALEINSYYDRLDLNDVNARNAVMKGVMLSINTDAHRINELNMIRFGIATARRGWLTKKNVLNTFSLQQLKKFLNRKNRK